MSAPPDKRTLDRAILRNAVVRAASSGPLLDEVKGWPPKVVLARVERLTEKGLLDIGVSVRTAWITDAGRARLAELEALP